MATHYALFAHLRCVASRDVDRTLGLAPAAIHIKIHPFRQQDGMFLVADHLRLNEHVPVARVMHFRHTVHFHHPPELPVKPVAAPVSMSVRTESWSVADNSVKAAPRDERAYRSSAASPEV